MSNAFDGMREALAQAKAVNTACDENAAKMCELLKGRLRHVGAWRLVELKRELRDFNMHTGKWKS